MGIESVGIVSRMGFTNSRAIKESHHAHIVNFEASGQNGSATWHQSYVDTLGREGILTRHCLLVTNSLRLNFSFRGHASDKKGDT